MSKSKKNVAGRQPVKNVVGFRRFQLALGYAIVGACVLMGIAMNLWPHRFGLPGPNPAVAVGLAALALFRLYVLRRELKRQEEDPEEDKPKKRQSKRRACASTLEGRVSS